MHELTPLSESQLRELINAQALWRTYQDALREAAQVRGSMVWKASAGHEYLVRKSASGAQKSLGPRSAETQAQHSSFQARKARVEARLKSSRTRLDEQRKLNRVYRVGRVPKVVVRIIAALEGAGLRRTRASGIRDEPGPE